MGKMKLNDKNHTKDKGFAVTIKDIFFFYYQPCLFFRLKIVQFKWSSFSFDHWTEGQKKHTGLRVYLKILQRGVHTVALMLWWDKRQKTQTKTQETSESDSKAIMITTKVTLSSLECRNLSPQAFAKNKWQQKMKIKKRERERNLHHVLLLGWARVAGTRSHFHLIRIGGGRWNEKWPFFLTSNLD
jgi:hypothetical protein